jgi:hypothetical protein
MLCNLLLQFYCDARENVVLNGSLQMIHDLVHLNGSQLMYFGLSATCGFQNKHHADYY